MSIKKPSENNQLIGHKQAQQVFLESIANNNLHHAFLISGTKGIGKATLAFQMAKFLLSGSKPYSDGMFGHEYPANLAIDESSKVFQLVASNSHPDFMVIDSSSNDKNVIKVDDTRKISEFLRLTPSLNKYKIVIIDSIDEMNVNAANSILKILEEPPANSYLFLVSHNPGKVIPTIKSRTRMLKLSPLSDQEIEKIIDSAVSSAKKREILKLKELVNGAPGLLLSLYEEGAIDIYKWLLETISNLPMINHSEIEKAATKKTKGQDNTFQITIEMLELIVASIIKSLSTKTPMAEIDGRENSNLLPKFQKSSLEDLLVFYEKVIDTKIKTEVIHLNKKLSMFCLLEQLGGVMR